MIKQDEGEEMASEEAEAVIAAELAEQSRLMLEERVIAAGVAMYGDEWMAAKDRAATVAMHRRARGVLRAAFPELFASPSMTPAHFITNQQRGE
jgi:hypothetical protein